MITILNTRCHPTSTIRASCGDDVTNKLALAISIRDRCIDYDSEKFVNCVTNMIVCFKCFVFYLTHGMIIFTEKGEKRWMQE